MKSPFPGMDPYLESHWGDVHTSFITYARDQLHQQLPRDLRVRVEECVTVQFAGAANGDARGSRSYYPDVRVLENPQQETASAQRTATAELAKPLIVPMTLEAQTERSLRIVDTSSGNRVITAIEFLSLSNKADPHGRANYGQKQRDLLAGKVNLVEIDLLRQGAYMLAVQLHCVPASFASGYKCCVVRACRPEQAELYAISLRERLPRIPVPLRETDSDAVLDLQELLERSYDNGGYDADIDYRIDPQPALQGDDAMWADQLLRTSGKR